MPYIVGEYVGAHAKKFACDRKPGGMGLSVDKAREVEKVVHIGSSFSDPGADWNRFEAYNAAGDLVATHTVDGY